MIGNGGAKFTNRSSNVIISRNGRRMSGAGNTGVAMQAEGDSGEVASDRRGGSKTGVVFAINGLLENTAADAVIVPTDVRFKVRNHWHALTGADYQRHRPADWEHRLAGQSPCDRSLWFLDVARPPVEMFAALDEMLADIPAMIPAPGGGRALPRIALPILGTAHGGHGGRRGQMIDGLLDTARGAVARSAVDVVLVAPARADFAALQDARRRSFDREPNADAQALATLAKRGELALFVGAGVSIPAGLPSWDALLAGIAADNGTELADLPDVLDRAELLRKELGTAFGAAVARQIEGATRPSLAHAHLAALGCREVVTTNFDTLYERAVRSTGRPLAMLPRDRPSAGQPWLLKLHGDITDPANIVLTRRDFVRFSADRGPAGAVLQSLMMTRHLFVVGASMTDANILRLAHEVMQFRNAHHVQGPVGTVLTLRPEPGLRRLWDGELTWISAGAGGQSDQQAGRKLEIFLDELSMWASEDGAYLFDERYAALLSARENQWAGQFRDLAVALDIVTDADHRGWGAVRSMLQEFGASLSPGPS